MPLKVYRTESIGATRNHIAIYIETAPTEDAGWLHHVTGTILNGMDYTPRETPNPVHLPEHVPSSMKQIATIEEEDLERFREECCLAVPPPQAQVTLRGTQLYPDTPLYRCGDWLKDVQELAFKNGIFKSFESEDIKTEPII
ncbi:uncharacterized protein N7529_002241 [Penicillium soppii]|jgi:hypothetical protein|uniref:uncharacterized protein n=1 Tax=Penicillium soppii TaxID=69789 RepID=UPI0025476AF9|nr:uncharacterized protein N7529_002241 [Penicillium soppii]KAJ5873811.1 hypothetical protein N7529_002241 [Penicillium soppii]